MKLNKSILLMMVPLMVLVGCKKKSSDENGTNKFVEVTLPNYAATTKDDKASWEHDNEEFSFTWFVNDSSFTWGTYGTDVVSQVIKEKTGASIKFVSPAVDDGQQLAAMIAGNTLPDVISILASSSNYSQLAMQGYAYPMNDLIEKWAPTFEDRLEMDVYKWFELGNGKTYGFPNFAYSNKYCTPEEKYEPNSCILVRKDWYELACANIEGDMTTKKSFIDGVQYITNLKGKNAIGIQLDQFNSEGNSSVELMGQYFATKYENSDGTYNYKLKDDHYKEALYFLNDCFNKGFILDENFSANVNQIRNSLTSKKVFVSMVTPQNYSQAFISLYNDGIEYVPLVLKNSENEDPILQDARGMGYLISMITTNCKRPDKVIKVFEYLYSEEGQRLVAFGKENDSWTWKDDEHSEIQWTQKYLNAVTNNEAGQFGIYKMTLLMNLAYSNKIKPLNGRKAVDVYIDNLKRPLSPYSYDYTAFFKKYDTTNGNYSKLATKQATLKSKWAEYLPKIVRADNNTKALAQYDVGMKYLEDRGLNDVISFETTGYNLAKQSLGLSFSWATHQSGYTSPITGPNGDFSYWRGME